VASPYDRMAERFERQRALPDGVVRSVRGAVTKALKHLARPRLLYLGAGGGRFGWPFVAASDDYVASICPPACSASLPTAARETGGQC
jgi:hypothetical protein